MARGKEFDDQAALGAAAELFWRKGYEATSIQDLVEATGVNRASLYATYGDKHQLFQKALTHYQDSTVRTLEDLGGKAGGLDRIRAVFQQAAEQTLSDCRGCMVANAVTALSSREAWMAETGKHARERIERFLSQCLQEAAAAGDIAAETSSPATARFLTNSLFGLRVMAKMKPTRALVEDIVRTTLTILR